MVNSMKIMGVDFGDARTGISICDKSEFLASPVCVIQETDFQTCAEKTAQQAKEQKQKIKSERRVLFLRCASVRLFYRFLFHVIHPYPVRNSAGKVGLKTSLGAVRIVDMPAGELVPRIC